MVYGMNTIGIKRNKKKKGVYSDVNIPYLFKAKVMCPSFNGICSL
jgi:hypothetical protein